MALPGLVRRLGHNAAHAARRVAERFALPADRGFWLLLRLAPPLDEQRPPPLPFQRDTGMSLLDALQILDAAAADPQLDGVLVRLAGAPGGWSQATALRRALLRVRESGRPVVAYGERLGTPELLVASAASRLWLPPSGSLALVGLRAEGFFLRGLLERLGVEPDVVRVGGFKTAAETFLRDSMSPEQRAQSEALLDDLYGELVEALAAGRGLAPEAVRERVDRGPWSAPAAVEAGLADACLYPDELEPELERLTPLPPPERPGPRRVRLVDAPSYGALRARTAGFRPLVGDVARLAYVVASGPIHGGRGPYGIAGDAFRELLERLRRDAGVKGVVLRLTSPGGDTLASDLLWRAVVTTRRDKPVVVSMGEVAASGGYYVAAAADAVLAEAGTVTGSIGVVGGKLSLERLYARLGVGRDGVERGARAGMLSESRGFTAEERAALRDEMQAIYGSFLDKVGEGRGLDRSAVERVAQGRVWSGARARELDLVDALGGPLEALAEARRRAGLDPAEPYLVETHPRHPRLAGLRLRAGLAGREGGGR